MKKAYKINIDLPKHPKGTIIYHEYEFLPSKFRVNESYAGNHKWYTKEGNSEIQVWPWISGLIESCLSMNSWESTAEKLVTEVKIEGGEK